MAGMNGKDIGDMACGQCCLPIEKGQDYVQCAHCKKTKIIYTKLHIACVEEHRAENKEPG